MTISAMRVATVVAALGASAALTAAQAPRQQRVSFKAGSSSATINGTISGYEAVDYLLGARAGQTMTVSLKTTHRGTSFNVLPPGSEAAIAIGEIVGDTWSGTLPADGDYRVRVSMVRAAARRNEKATYTLTVGITGRADAKVAGTPYHATGIIPCSVGTDPKGSAQCSVGVIRGENGNAEVYLADPGFDVTLHKDKLRVLRFAGSRVTSKDPKEIPDAVIVGG
jgi:hypothetical protein